MAIDFSQVKTITIPEGSVTKITDSTGNILWKAQTEGWHTVWEGSQKIGYGGQIDRKVFATVPYSDALKIRVSFSELYAYPISGQYHYMPTNKVSPVTHDHNSFVENKNPLVYAYTYNTSTDGISQSYLSYNKSTGEIYGGNYMSGDLSGTTTYIVITKIEVSN